ncbi:uncharacterized protein [Diabrotica undecimpunctata]|uniref:uncharacterized protein n=1 Tax=Diabrotica undecimpunctata TaxID=50387 RepID=UPI003B636537
MDKKSKSSSSFSPKKRESISKIKTLKVVPEKFFSKSHLPKKAQLKDTKIKKLTDSINIVNEEKPENVCQRMTRSNSKNLSSKRLRTLQTVVYKNKYFPEEYLPKKTKLVESILEEKKKSLNLSTVLDTEDEEEIAENVRRDLLDDERKRIFSSVPPSRSRRKKPIKADGNFKMPFDVLQESKLKRVLSQLSRKEKPVKLHKSVLKCIPNMASTPGNIQKRSWKSPSYLLSTIVECLLKRKWNILTYLILDLINLSQEALKPIIRQLYEVCDRYHPVIQEHGLKGKYKDIKRFKPIGNDTHIV